MNPPFAPSGHPDDQPQQFQLSIWFLDPTVGNGVDMESGLFDSFATGEFYVSIAWSSGEITTIPRERVVKMQVAPASN